MPLQGTQEYQQQLRQLAQQVDPSDVQLYYQIALQGRQDLKLAVSLQQGFDMCILRMLAFKPLGNNSQILEDSSAGSIAAQQPSQINASNHSPVVQPASATADQQHHEQSINVVAEPTQQSSATHAIEIIDQPEIAVPATFHASAPKDEQVRDHFAENTVLENQLFEHQTVDNDLLVQDEFFVSQPNAIAIQSASEAEEIHKLDLFGQPFTAMPNELTPAAPLIAAFAGHNSKPQSVNEQLTDEQLSDEQLVEAADTVTDSPTLEIPVTDNEPADAIDNHSRQLLPQQILQHRSVELTGAWDIEKWERWLREAAISPAIRNLAQHGLMRGEIGQSAAFVISPEHRLMATELFDGLIAALKQQWPECHVELVFEHIDEPLPLELKAIRREKALQQADHLLRQEPVIQPLIAKFEASLTNVSFKE